MSPGPAGAMRRAIAGLGLEPFELPSGAGHDAAIMGMAGVPVGDAVRTQRRGRHQPRARGDDRRRRRRAACVQALEPALRELAARMTDWDALARPSLRGLERYDPGASRDELKAAATAWTSSSR